MAPQGSPEEVGGHDFIIPELGRAGTVRGLRQRRQRGLGERGDERRYGGIRGWDHPALVARDWPRPLSRREIFDHHRRWRRKQRLAGSVVETRVAAALRRTRARDQRTPPAAWLPANGTRSSTDCSR